MSVCACAGMSAEISVLPFFLSNMLVRSLQSKFNVFTYVRTDTSKSKSKTYVRSLLNLLFRWLQSNIINPHSTYPDKDIMVISNIYLAKRIYIQTGKINTII